MKKLIKVISATTLTAISLTGCFNPADNRNMEVYGPAKIPDENTTVIEESSSVSTEVYEPADIDED
jgi:hypothetical protein